MPPKDAFAGYCAELLAVLGPVRMKRMFGGQGFYVDDIFIAFVSGETLYLKVDAQSLPRFEAAGCEPFVYSAKGRSQVSLNYRAAPADAMESPALMRPWARLAMEAALRARAK
jgi:DNA transformation protein and related proteins